MLRDEAGAHVAGLELRVAGETQQEVDVGVQSHDLRVVGQQDEERAAVSVAVESGGTKRDQDNIKTRENRDQSKPETLYIQVCCFAYYLEPLAKNNFISLNSKII